MSKKLYSNVAISILISLGVSACGSKGGSSPTSTDISQVNQIKKLKEQIEAEVKEKSKAAANKAAQDLAKANQALENANAATAAEQAKAQAAANKAAQDLAKANAALEASKAETAAEQAKAQAAAEKAAQDLAKANQALEASKAETAAEQAKAQAAANKAAQDLAKANQALEASKAETAAEQAKAQAAAEKAAQDLAKANQALEASKAETSAEQAKAQAEAEKAARDLAALQEQYNNLVNKDEIEKAKKEAELELAKERLKEAVAKREIYDLTDQSWRVLDIEQSNQHVNGRVQYSKSATVPKDNVVLITKEIDFSKSPVEPNVYHTSDNIKVINKSFSKGEVVSSEENAGRYYYINQDYSSYASFDAYQFDTLKYLDSRNNLVYVALPTKLEAEIFKGNGKYTYTGYAMKECCDPPNGNLTLNLFVYPTSSFVKGEINFGNYDKYVLGVANVNLANTDTHFRGKVDYSYRKFKDDRNLTRRTDLNLNYFGVFAGPNAEEVVGAVEGYGPEASFGGKR